MKREIKATFCVASWNETVIDESEGLAKLTHANCTQTYEGDIEASSSLQYVMAYGADGTANFVGIERIDGEVLGRSGSFVLQHDGRFADGVARMQMRIVEGAGRGELEGLRGHGEFESPHAEKYVMTLMCELPD